MSDVFPNEDVQSVVSGWEKSPSVAPTVDVQSVEFPSSLPHQSPPTHETQTDGRLAFGIWRFELLVFGEVLHETSFLQSKKSLFRRVLVNFFSLIISNTINLKNIYIFIYKCIWKRGGWHVRVVFEIQGKCSNQFL